MARERSMRWSLAVALATTTACPNDPGDSTDSGNTIAADSTLTTAPSEDSSSTTDAVDESTTMSPSTTVSDESSSSGGGGLGCGNANPCAGGYCVAPYADNDHGEFVCIADCVLPGDEASWCFDASSCCDPEATCTERGYCVLPDDMTGSSSSSSSG